MLELEWQVSTHPIDFIRYHTRGRRSIDSTENYFASEVDGDAIVSLIWTYENNDKAIQVQGKFNRQQDTVPINILLNEVYWGLISTWLIALTWGRQSWIDEYNLLHRIAYHDYHDFWQLESGRVEERIVQRQTHNPPSDSVWIVKLAIVVQILSN